MIGRYEQNLPFGATPSPGPERNEEISHHHSVCEGEPPNNPTTNKVISLQSI